MTAATITGSQGVFWRPSAPAAPPLRVAHQLRFDRRLAAIVMAVICAFTLLLGVAPTATSHSLFGAETGVAAQTDPATVFVAAETPGSPVLVGETGPWSYDGTLGCCVAPGSLVDELAAAGIKHSPDDIVRIARDSSGRIVFLEAGNSRAGLAHIVAEHADDFAARGVSVDQIPDLVTNAATQGRIVGYQGTGTGRPIYEIGFGGSTHRVAVTVGDNGFIVGANPA